MSTALLPVGWNDSEDPVVNAQVIEREAGRMSPLSPIDAAWLDGFAACLRADVMAERDACEDEDHEDIEAERDLARRATEALDAARGIIKRMAKLLDRSGTLSDDMRDWLNSHPGED
jgi:hypothetical protein